MNVCLRDTALRDVVGNERSRGEDIICKALVVGKARRSTRCASKHIIFLGVIMLATVT